MIERGALAGLVAGRYRPPMRALSVLLATILVAHSLGCGSDSNAMESDDMCFDEAALPLGMSLPSIDAVCSDPPSPVSVLAEQQQRQNLEAAAATAAELLRSDAITVVTCGTGTPIPSDRAQSCTAVFANGLFLLFDAGDGAQRSMERLLLPVDELDAVFLTHFHSDHLADLGEVVSRSWILGRKQNLPVFGGEGLARVVKGFNAIYALDDNYRTAHHGADILPPEIAPATPNTVDGNGEIVFEQDGVTVSAFTVNHPPIEPAFGYRVDFAGRSVVISGDTTATDSLFEMSRDADVLVAEVLSVDVVEDVECALRRLDQERNATILRDVRTYHIGTDDLADLAEEARVGTLVLTHLVPSFDNDDPRVDAFFTNLVAAGFGGNVVAARDGTRVVVELGASPP